MEIIVTPVGRFWAVTQGDKVYSKREDKHVALADAIKAAKALPPAKRAVVTVEDGDDDTARLVWDSTRDGLGEA